MISSAPGGGLFSEAFKTQGGGTLFMQPDEKKRRKVMSNQRQ
jgi:hypothetical protein